MSSFEAENMTLGEVWWRSTTEQYTHEQLMVFVTWQISTISYIVVSLVYFIVQFIPAMNKYKIQPNEHVSVKYQLLSVFRVFYNTCILTWLPLMFAYMVPQLNQLLRGLSVDYSSLPPWFAYPAGCYLSLMIADLWIYMVHRYISHHPKLYRHIHKTHHEYGAPFGLANNYADGTEAMLHAIGLCIGSSIAFTHISQLWLYTALQTWHGISTHSGYQCWFLNPLALLPGVSTPAEHDIHHEKNMGNFGPSCIIWDHLFGTYVTPRRTKLGYHVDLDLHKNKAE